MNPTELQTWVQLSNIPIVIVLITWVSWKVVPKLLSIWELQAKAFQDLAKIVESLQHEVRESRRVSEDNSRTLAEVTGKVDTLLDLKNNPARPVRARKVGE